MQAGMVGRMGPAGGSTPEANALIAAMAVPPDRTRRLLINTMMKALKSSGILDKLDALWVMAAHDRQAARLNWKNPSVLTLSEVNSPSWTADRGFAGDGSTSYLDTGVNLAAGGLQFQQNAAHMGVWCNVAQGSGAFTDIGTTNNFLRAYTGFATLNVRLNMASTQAIGGLSSTELGHTVVSRTDGTTTIGYRNGAAGATNATASVGMSPDRVFLCCGNNGGSPGTFTSRRYAVAHIGGALTATDQLNLYNALNGYLQAVGGA